MGEWPDEGDAESRTGGDPKGPAGFLERLSRRVGGLLRLGQLSLAFPQDACSSKPLFEVDRTPALRAELKSKGAFG